MLTTDDFFVVVSLDPNKNADMVRYDDSKCRSYSAVITVGLNVD